MDPRPRVPVPHRVAPGHGGLRLDRYLQIRFPWHSRTAIQRLIRDGIVAGDRPLRPASRLLEGESLTLWLAAPREEAADGPPPDLPVLYEDDHVLAIDKPAGLLSHPVRHDRKVAVVTLVRRRFSDAGSALRPTLAHRLDRETSGVLLLAKDPRTDRRLKDALEHHRVRKVYEAVVRGVPGWDEAEVDRPLGPDAGSPIGIRQAIVEGGLAAWTRFEVVERREGCARVRAFPRSGRMHQIRVHLEGLGHPLVGDKIYGRPPEVFLGWLERGLDEALLSVLELPRHALHAAEVGLEHPITGEPLSIHAPFPEDLRTYLETHPPAAPADSIDTRKP